MIKLVVFAGFALSIAVSAQAMTPAQIPQPDSMITEVAAACGTGRARVNGVAWHEPPSARPAGMRDRNDLLVLMLSIFWSQGLAV